MAPPSVLVLALVLSLVVAAASWSPPSLLTQSKPSTATTPSPLSNRRSFLSRSTAAVAAPLLQVAVACPPKSASAALTQETALAQWKASVATIDNLLENWDDISKRGGDVIRAELGTANFGTDVSPLFQIEKAFRILREGDDVDLVDFTERTEEFAQALARADTMAYSANFAGGSGKPTPPEVYLEKSRKEVEGLKQIAKGISSLL